MSANRLQFWSRGWSFSTAFQLFAKFGNFLFLDSDSKEQYIKKKKHAKQYLKNEGYDTVYYHGIQL